MAICLTKGQSVQLNGAGNISVGVVGLAWDSADKGQKPVDLDLVAFMLGRDGVVRKDEDFIFYNNLSSPCGSLKHTGDERTGASEGDDECILVKIPKIPYDVESIVFATNIDKAKENGQNFGKVKNAYCRFINLHPNGKAEELVRYNLTEEFPEATCMVMCELYRKGDGEWSFRAIGQAYRQDLAFLCRMYGVNI